MNINTAIIQHSAYEPVELARDKIGQKILSAAKNGAKLIILPELHNSPYFAQVEDPRHFALAETIPGPSTDYFAAIAKQANCVIVLSLFEQRAPGLYHNTAVVIETDGSIAGVYRKMHIPDDPGYYEKYYFAPGDSDFSPIQTSVGQLGVLICWDQWYPEAARLMALAGADLLIYPTAIGWDNTAGQSLRQTELDAWITIQRAHAIANGIPVIACNRCGFEANLHDPNTGIAFWGNSFAVGADGHLLAQAEQQTTTLSVQIDTDQTTITRHTWPFLRDRRIDAYHDLVKRWRK